MRWWMVFLVVLETTVAAQPSETKTQRIAILGLEAISPNKDAINVARTYTVALRNRVATGPYKLAPNSLRELAAEKKANKCESEAIECMVKIGAALAADFLVYGKLELKGTSYQVTLKRLDVTKRAIDIGWTDVLAVADVGTKLEGHAAGGFHKLFATTCDPTAKLKKGDEAATAGSWAAALAAYEEALKCAPDDARTIKKVFMSACRSRQMAKAKYYFKKLSEDAQRQLAPLCIREGIDPN